MNLVKSMAHKYLDLGWSVIPIRHKSKIPAIGSWKEYQKRLPTREELDKWFDDPNTNIALVTGAVSKVSVLDGDGEEGVNSLSQLGISSPVQQKSGKGKHLFFNDADGSVKNFVRKWPGLDARGEGGYVLVYPSIHENGVQYRWLGLYNSSMPEFPKELVSEKPQETLKPKLDVEKLLKNVGPGNRHDTLLRLIGKFINQKWEDDQIMAMLAPLLEKFNEEGVEKDAFESAVSIINSLREKEHRNVPTELKTEQCQTSMFSVFSPNGNLKGHRERLLAKASYQGPEISTGLPMLDRYTGGFIRGELFTVAARTGIGKTSISVSFTKQLLRSGKRVLFFSTEMSSDLITNRLLSSITGIGGESFKTGKFDQNQLEQLDKGYSELEGYGELLAVCDLSSPDIEKVKLLADKYKPDVIIFDHVQHIGGKSDSIRVNITEFIRGLKNIARDFNCAILVLSQLRRMFVNPKSGAMPAPQLSDLKESGTIEEESGQVLLLSVISEEPGSPICSIVGDLAKNRFGECARIGFNFDRSTARFNELDFGGSI